ncbi:transglutaminase domain-containing protein [Actinotalea sp. BY-33]|uniref:Transglutaminase domain-containing protein n=1 Tax=Actinotalea soli TaxID=2819234 RepID=A0A939RSC5_9CELL|nr:transglutaminase-like domain-containing protein [Actinotalea soli]MBO1750787.1 transglutaminase domain-containing protein [Actinotalea soli]
MTPRPTGPATTGWALALLLVAAVPLAASFTTPVVLALVLGALLAPVGIVALGRWLRVPPWGVASGGLSLVLGVALAFARAEPAPAGPASEGTWRAGPGGSLVAPLADAVARLLTAPRPAPLELALPVLLLCALVSLGVALALARGSAARLAPLVGAAVIYGAGQLLSAGAADGGVVATACVVVAAAGWVVLDGGAVGRSSTAVRLGEAPRRARVAWTVRGLAGLVSVLVVGAGAVVVASAVDGRPFEPRELVAPPQVPADLANPMAELARWQAEPDLVLLTVAGEHPGYLSWVTLPDFDGAGWGASLDLRPVGSVVEPALAPGRDRGAMDVTVELVGLAGSASPPGPWLPSAGQVTETDLTGALVDADSGVLMLPVGQDGRLPDGLTYRVRSEVDQPDAVRAARAGVPAGDEVDRYLALPRFPAEMREYAQAVVEGASSRVDQATLIAQEVRGERELATDAIGGSSYVRLREFLFADRGEGGQVGTSEQFAASFAVLARAVGLPSRLVVGFALDEPGTGSPVTVRGQDARVWAEVYLAGTGWVRFDPAPDAATASGLRDEPEEQDVSDAEPEPEGLPEAPPPGADDDPVASDAVPDGVDRGGVVVAVLLALAGAAGVVLVGLVAARGLRRRRLRAAGAVGAWQLVADSLVLRRGRPAPAATVHAEAHEVADLVRASDRGTARGVDHEAAGLALAAEAEAFGPPVEVATSDGTWDAARRVERGLRRGAPRGRRLGWWIDPRPLRRR